MTVLDHFRIDLAVIQKKHPSEEARRALDEVAELAEFWLTMNRRLARQAVDRVIDLDLRDRAGLQEAFEEIDAATQEELREKWTDIVMGGA